MPHENPSDHREPVANGYLELDGAGRVRRANPAAERLLGVHAGELTGRALVPDLSADPGLAAELAEMGAGTREHIRRRATFAAGDGPAPEREVIGSRVPGPEPEEARIALMLAEPVAPAGGTAPAFYEEMFRRNTAPKLLIEAESGRIVDANPAALDFYGYSLPALRARTIQDINTLSEEEVRAERERARREERRYFEFRHRLADGQVRDVKVYSGPIEVDGRPHLHSIIHDVTEERRHREHLEAYKAIFQALPVGVYRTLPGEEGFMREANPAMARILGADSVAELLRVPMARLHRDPEEHRRLGEELLRRGSVQRRELAMRTLDGRPVEVAVTARVHEQEDGAPVFDGIIEDVTRSRRAEAEAAERQRRESFIHSVLGGIPDMIFHKTLDGVYVECNEEFGRLVDRSPATIAGCTDHDLFSPETADFFREQDRRMLERGQARHNEEWVRYPDGRWALLDMLKTPYRDADDQLRGIIGIGRDITERKNAEEARRRTEGQLRSLIEHFPGGVLFEDTRRRVLLANRPFVELLGIPAEPEDLVGSDCEAAGQAAKGLFRDPEGFITRTEQRIAARETALAETLEMADGRVLERDYVPVPGENGEGLGHLWLYRDVTGQKRTEERLRESASVFEHANEGIMITDAGGTILDVNAAFTQITGYTREEVLGDNPRLLKSGVHGRDYYDRMWAALQREGRWSSEVWNRRKDGRLYVAMQTISAIQDGQGGVRRYVSLFSDITSLKEYQDWLERMAHYDPLTSLPNRSLLADRLHQAMARAERGAGPLAVAYIDLDGFKAVNDTHGHDRGDELLTGVAERLQAALRGGDTLARVGGDEFVAVLLDLHGREDAEPVIQRLLEAATQPVHADGLELRSTASIGLSFYPQAESLEPDQLVRQADQAMYTAKQAGKNRSTTFDPAHDQAVRGQHEAMERVREALVTDELVLHYQPKVDMQSGEVVGVEALIRWAHPQRGLLLPGSFLPSISETPAAVEVGDWVLETAAAQAEAWRQSGIALPVSINVDGYQFARPDFLDKLRDCLDRHPGLGRGDLELEVLESSALEDIDRVREIIAACDELGVAFALDDFGTGYSTLTHLKRLPAPLLKIDQSFVRDMLDDPEDLAILDGIQGLADAFQRRTIAEGVETVAHGVMLLALGCQLGQGFGIARPMPPEELPAWLAAWQPDPQWQERQRVRNDDLPALFAMVEHRAWLARVEAALDHGAPVPENAPEACRFGQWLRQQAADQGDDTPELARIRDLHQQLHAEVAGLAETGMPLEGATRERLRALSETLLLRTEEMVSPGRTGD